MKPLENQQKTEVYWSSQDLMLLGLIIQMMELDPTFKRWEQVFREAWILRSD